MRDGDDREAGRLGRARQHHARRSPATTAGRSSPATSGSARAPMCDLFLVLAQTDEGVTCFALPRVLPDGTRNGFHIQRLKDKLGNRSNAVERGRVPRRPGRAWSASPAAACRRSSRWSTTRAWTASSGRRPGCARRSRRRRGTRRTAAPSARLVDQPLMRNVLADLCDRVRGRDDALALRLARAYDDPATRCRRVQAAGHRGRQVLGLQARARPRLRGAGVPGRQRLRRGVRDAAPVPRGAAELDLGGLGQRHGPRRPARAGAQPEALDAFFAEVDEAAGADARSTPSPPPRARSSPTSRRSSRAPGASSSAWRWRCRARCSCATPRRPSPTRSAPRAWRRRGPELRHAAGRRRRRGDRRAPHAGYC